FPDNWTISLGETAEEVAERYGITREEHDRFALASQQRAGAAQREGRFSAELVPVEVPQRKGPPLRVDADEHPRPDVTLERLRSLPPAFRPGGTVTAGNSSGLNDGAAPLLIVEAGRARSLGLEPLARLVSTGVAGVQPDLAGMGPVPATRKAVERAGIAPADL